MTLRSRSRLNAILTIGRLFRPAIGIFLLGYAFGQSQATTGNIEGTVIDPNGAPVPNTTIAALNQNTGLSRIAVSNGDGAFMLILLPSGLYTLSAEPTQGFAPYEQRDVDVTVGARVTVEIRLAPGTSVSKVDVLAGASGIEPTRTSITSTTDKIRIETLPGLLRNFQENAMRAPGIIRDKTRGGDFAVGGQKGSLNSLQIDGVSTDNTYFGQSVGRVGTNRVPFQFSNEAIKEYQVSKTGFSPEFGRAAGGIINVVTMSGSNRFRGVAFFNFRDEALTANSPRIKADQASVGLPNTRAPQRAVEFGATFGGPLKKDKAFFFGSFDSRHLTTTSVPFLRSLQYAPSNVRLFLEPKVVPFCACGPNDTFLIRTDFNRRDRDQIWIRFNTQKFDGRNFSNPGSNGPPENEGSYVVETLSAAAGWTSILSDHWFNEYRVQYLRDHEFEEPNSTTVGATLNATNAGGFNDGPFSFGSATGLPREVTIDRVQFIDGLTRTFANHTVKFGVDVLLDRIYVLATNFSWGSYTFQGYDALSAQLSLPTRQAATRYRQNFSVAGPDGWITRVTNQEYGFYFQDEWRVNRRLTLSAGIRYDYQDIPRPLIRNSNPGLLAAGYDTSFGPSDTNNFAPRIGASYAFNSKTVLRGGYGIFYARTPAVMTVAAHSLNGIKTRLLDLRCSDTPSSLCPIYPSVFPGLTSGLEQVPISIFLFDRGYRQPFTHQAHVEFEREIMRDTTVSAHYAMFRGDDLPRTRNANLTPPIPTPVPVYLGSTPTGEVITFQRFPESRRIAGFSQVNLFESTARSFYQGMSVVLRRNTRNLRLDAHYTLSQANDDRPDQIPGSPNNIIENEYDLPGVYGRSDIDMKHRFILSEVYETGRVKIGSHFAQKLLSNTTVSGTFTVQSSIPYSAHVSGDPNNDGVTVLDILPGTQRNQYLTPWTYIIDLRVSRRFHFTERYRLSLLANAYNLLNRSNVLLANETSYTYSGQSATLPARLTRVANFGTPRVFVSPTQGTGTAITTANRTFLVGIRFEY